MYAVCCRRFDSGWAKTISGTEEAIYGWVALNYQEGLLHRWPTSAQNPQAATKTLGALDLGGSSLEVALELASSPEGSSPEHLQGQLLQSLVNVTVAGTTHWLHVHMFKGYGLNEVYDRGVALLLDDHRKKREEEGEHERLLELERQKQLELERQKQHQQEHEKEQLQQQRLVGASSPVVQNSTELLPNATIQDQMKAELAEAAAGAAAAAAAGGQQPPHLEAQQQQQQQHDEEAAAPAGSAPMLSSSISASTGAPQEGNSSGGSGSLEGHHSAIAPSLAGAGALVGQSAPGAAPGSAAAGFAGAAVQVVPAANSSSVRGATAAGGSSLGQGGSGPWGVWDSQVAEGVAPSNSSSSSRKSGSETSSSRGNNADGGASEGAVGSSEDSASAGQEGVEVAAFGASVGVKPRAAAEVIQQGSPATGGVMTESLLQPQQKEHVEEHQQDAAIEELVPLPVRVARRTSAAAAATGEEGAPARGGHGVPWQPKAYRGSVGTAPAVDGGRWDGYQRVIPVLRVSAVARHQRRLQQQQYRLNVLQLWLLDGALPALLGAQQPAAGSITTGMEKSGKQAGQPTSSREEGASDSSGAAPVGSAGGSWSKAILAASPAASEAQVAVGWQQKVQTLWHWIGAAAAADVPAGKHASAKTAPGAAAAAAKVLRQLLGEFPVGVEPVALSKRNRVSSNDLVSAKAVQDTISGAGEPQLGPGGGGTLSSYRGWGAPPAAAVDVPGRSGAADGTAADGSGAAGAIVDMAEAAAALGAGGGPAAHGLDVWMDPLPHPCLHSGYKAKYKRVVYNGVVPDPAQVGCSRCLTWCGW